MNLCLLFYGQARTYDNPEVIKSWKNFFNKYKCKNYLCLWDNIGRSAYSKLVNIKDDLQEDEKVDLEKIKNIFNTDDVELYNYNSWLSSIPKNFLNYKNDKNFNTTFAASFLRQKTNKFIKHGFDAYLIVRPDLYFINEIPEYYFNNSNFIYHQNAKTIFYPNRVYDIFLFSNYENAKLLTSLYESELFMESINKNFGTNLDSLDICKVLYSYLCLNEKINLLVSTDKLYVDVFRNNSDVENYKKAYGENK
jgi:hypothetical protein